MSSRAGAKARVDLASSAAATAARGGTGNAEKPKQRRKYAEIDVRAMMAGGAPADGDSKGLGCLVEGTTPSSGHCDLSSEVSSQRCLQIGVDPVVTSHAGDDGEISGTASDQASQTPDRCHEEQAPTTHILVKSSRDADETGEPQPQQQCSPTSGCSSSGGQSGAQLQTSATGDGAVSRHQPPLPRGWRQCEDDSGETYYWHVRSGAVQRERPTCAPGSAAADSPAEFVPDPNDWRDSSIPLITAPASRNKRSQSKSKSPSPRKEVHDDEEQDAKCSEYLNQCEGHLNNLTESCMRDSTYDLVDDDIARRREGTPADSRSQEQRFPARSLGWLSLVESDLADAESSSKAINKCITELTSSCRANDGALWTEGKEIYLDIEGTELHLTDPATAAVLCTQSVQSIRVWAISGQSPSDFAYVARDLGTRQLKCHVFRCEFAARRVTEALQAACGRAATERKRRSTGTPPSSVASSTPVSPDGLPPGKSVAARSDPNNPTLPSPMEGPKKAIRCHYMGAIEVHRPTGIDILNGAIEKVMHRNNTPSLWQAAVVVVSPSVVSISDAQDESLVLAECRIRYLAFLGISSTDVRLCGFIVHTAEDEFVAHIFHCEPSAGAICKTIEAACKLRFQKCLDAQPDLDVSRIAAQASAGKALQDTVKKGVQNILSKMWPSRKA